MFHPVHGLGKVIVLSPNETKELQTKPDYPLEFQQGLSGIISGVWLSLCYSERYPNIVLFDSGIRAACADTEVSVVN